MGSAVALLWFAALRVPVLAIAGALTGAEMAETASLSIIQLIRFAAGTLFFAFIPILAYLGWLRLMRPDAGRAVGAFERFLTWTAAAASAAFFIICWLPSVASSTSARGAFHEAAATDALSGDGIFLGNVLAGAAVTTALLVLFGLIRLFLAPPPRPAADTPQPTFPTNWWSWVPVPAFMVGVLAGALPFVS